MRLVLLNRWFAFEIELAGGSAEDLPKDVAKAEGHLTNIRFI